MIYSMIIYDSLNNYYLSITKPTSLHLLIIMNWIGEPFMSTVVYLYEDGAVQNVFIEIHIVEMELRHLRLA